VYKVHMHIEVNETNGSKTASNYSYW
jgi:hypothetical protein